MHPGSSSDDGDAWWSRSADALWASLQSRPAGLTTAQAGAGRASAGPNTVPAVDQTSPARLLWRQFSSPLVLILVIASVLSLLLRDRVDAATILLIVAGSTLLGFWQELRAPTASTSAAR